MKTGSIFLLCLLFINLSCKDIVQKESDTIVVSKVGIAQNGIERLEPANWWVGMENSALQLLVKHPDISERTPEIKYPGVSISKVHKADSPNYLFIDLNIAETTKAGSFNIVFKQANKDDLIHTYELKTRRND